MSRPVAPVLLVVGFGLIAFGPGCKSSKGTSNNNTPVTCGNGTVEAPEFCDGADLAGASCTSLGLGSGNLACQADCSYDFSGCSTQPVCGDGIINGAEICDGNNLGFADCRDAGFLTGTLACTGSCTWDTSGCTGGGCGNGQLDGALGEQCDDGNTTAGDGCDANCQLEIPASCGDGVLDTGETCDCGTNPSNLPAGCTQVNSDVSPDACRTNCESARCGDGVADFAAGEGCDDGNTVTGDGCDAACAVEPPSSCGDAVLDVGNGEECDDGNTMANDGCSAACQLEPVGGVACGDGTQLAPEICDDGGNANGDGCNPTCNLLGDVTTLNNNIDGNVLASDNTYLYVGIGNCQGATACGIGQIDIAACLASPTGAECNPTFIVGGPGACSCASGGGCGGQTLTPLVDGDAATVTFGGFVGSLATDGSKIWVADRHTIREVDLSSMITTTVAGNETKCGAVDGVGTNAYIHGARGLTYWNGLVYFLDGCEAVLRAFDPVSRRITTIAGNRRADGGVNQTTYDCPPLGCNCNSTPMGSCCPSATPAPGYGLSAVFNSPRYLTADGSGNLYVIDTNGNAIFRYNTVTTYAEILVSGTTPSNQIYNEGPAPGTTVGRPRGIVSDGTSVYWAEQHFGTVRQLQLDIMNSSTLVGLLGCTASPRDGIGADISQSYCGNYNAPQCNSCTSTPGNVPIFNPIVGGALDFNYRFNSIFIIDGNRLRRIE